MSFRLYLKAFRLVLCRHVGILLYFFCSGQVVDHFKNHNVLVLLNVIFDDVFTPCVITGLGQIPLNSVGKASEVFYGKFDKHSKNFFILPQIYK